jgi:tRNA (adenine57-N1/adenine58-N1)-methyltransferase catalytic subunit
MGDRVMLIDRKDRRYLLRLKPGAMFQSHSGVIYHDELVGLEDASTVLARQKDETEGKDSPARRFLAIRPTLSDVVLKMPRGAQVIYPKDLGAIVVAADLFPGARVLEAGVGSGALSMMALRSGCIVTGYEIREDFAEHAKKNVFAELGDDAPYDVQIRDVYEGIDERELDRILLDLPEPWRALDGAEKALRSGGIICAYLPSINQTAEFRAALYAHRFALAHTIEVLHRSWHIEGRAVRPDHRMVAHTGFLTTARLMAPGAIVERREESDDEVVFDETGAE